MLAITCGLPATGKSTLARALPGFEVISSDLVRKEMAGIAPEERRLEGFEGGIYSPGFTQRTYDELFRRARPPLLEGRAVVLDASFNRREYRRAAARLARETGAQFACLYFELPEARELRLLEARFRGGRGPSDARPEIFRQQKRRFQPPAEIAEERLIPVPPKGPLDAKSGAVMKALRALSPLSLR
jgi:predicted kinase